VGSIAPAVAALLLALSPAQEEIRKDGPPATAGGSDTPSSARPEDAPRGSPISDTAPAADATTFESPENSSCPA